MEMQPDYNWDDPAHTHTHTHKHGPGICYLSCPLRVRTHGTCLHVSLKDTLALFVLWGATLHWHTISSRLLFLTGSFRRDVKRRVSLLCVWAAHGKRALTVVTDTRDLTTTLNMNKNVSVTMTIETADEHKAAPGGSWRAAACSCRASGCSTDGSGSAT